MAVSRMFSLFRGAKRNRKENLCSIFTAGFFIILSSLVTYLERSWRWEAGRRTKEEMCFIGSISKEGIGGTFSQWKVFTHQWISSMRWVAGASFNAALLNRCIILNLFYIYMRKKHASKPTICSTLIHPPWFILIARFTLEEYFFSPSFSFSKHSP